MNDWSRRIINDMDPAFNVFCGGPEYNFPCGWDSIGVAVFQGVTKLAPLDLNPDGASKPTDNSLAPRFRDERCRVSWSYDQDHFIKLCLDVFSRAPVNSLFDVVP